MVDNYRNSLNLKKFWESLYEKLDINVINDIPSIFESDIEGANIFLNNLKDDENILDFGCGFGRNTMYLLKHNYSLSISDISDKSMDICAMNASNLGYHVEKIKYDATINCESNKFDNVIIWSVLDHTTLNKAKSIISEITRVCKKNALILCSFDGEEELDKNSYRLNEDNSIVITKGKNTGMVLRYFKNDEILNLFKDKWEVVYFYGMNPESEKIIICKKK